ncbi:hypothetical protein DYBT9623_00025 [Dyadobacter sp. CECT 9623]|uniref:Uncharacterized protein n=1 Tax=Dyadobacter linearis TaxID=2823330 RepID=A0ABM8UIR7_9BACT|nr:hypothetical protein DYBT9623_00025 [Dyadobacter sp. CECT 9623]
MALTITEYTLEFDLTALIGREVDQDELVGEGCWKD